MTREVAIEGLKAFRREFSGYEPNEEMFDMAIKALEQEPMEKFKSVKDHIFKLAGDYKCWDNRLTDDEVLELCHILEQEPRKRTMQLVIDNKKQKKFAHEIIKKFSFEELALFMYENSCEYCQKQHNCMGNVTPQDCAKNIRQKFEKSYFETGEMVEE